MSINLLKGAGLAVVAGLALSAPLGSNADAGVLDQLRARGLGNIVDKYVENKNGDIRFKRGKTNSVSELVDRAGVKGLKKKKTGLKKAPAGAATASTVAKANTNGIPSTATTAANEAPSSPSDIKVK